MQEESFIEIALVAVKKAEPIFQKSFGNATGILTKDDFSHSLVTDVDKEIETLIRKELAENFPEHSIVGEEFPKTENSSEYVWYLDPIDGTSNYIKGLPFCAISLALWRLNKPIIGIINNPISGDSYYAVSGQGAFCNDKKISVSSVSVINEAFGAFGANDSHQMEKLFDKIASISKKWRILGSHALQICLVANGSLDYFVADKGFHMWDVAAGISILEEAGGNVTDWQGNPFTQNSKNIVASNGYIHKEILKAFQESN